MKINFKLNIKTILLVLLIAWGAFSVWYVLNDQWQDFKVNEKEKAYQLGKEDGANMIVKQVVEETSKCKQPLPATHEDKTVNIVSVECL